MAVNLNNYFGLFVTHFFTNLINNFLPIGNQNSTLLFGVVLKNTMPKFQATHEIFEVGKGDPAQTRTVKCHDNLTTHL